MKFQIDFLCFFFVLFLTEGGGNFTLNASTNFHYFLAISAVEVMLKHQKSNRHIFQYHHIGRGPIYKASVIKQKSRILFD